MLVLPVVMNHRFHFGMPLFGQAFLGSLPPLIPMKLSPLR
jgi:hypothetical protein